MAKKLTNDEIGILIFIPSFIIGAFFRIHPPAASGFPINDGALFLQIIETIQVNNFELPFHVGYNQMDIPLAYPPLAFYIAGATSSLFNIPNIQVVTWMPAIVLVLTMPFVFFLARLLTNSALQAGMAVFFYALLPRSILWLVMGGGVTRSLGNLFLIIATTQIYLMITEKKRVHIFSSAIFCGLTCATHPEAALHTALIGILIWVIFDKKISGLKNGLFVVLGTIVLTSPWWILVLSRFGFTPFLSAGKTGLHNTIILELFNNFGQEQLVTIVSVLAILGFFLQISKKQPFLPAWIIFSFIIEPRNAPNVAMVPVSILASIYLTETVLPGLSRLNNSKPETQGKHGLNFDAPVSKAFLTYLCISLLAGMALFDFNLSSKIVSADNRKAFEWIKNNTVKGGEFLVITGNPNLFDDSVNEWFPYLTGRKSQTTIQGQEWLSDVDFGDQINLLEQIQGCVKSSTAIGCIEERASQNQIGFNYIFIVKSGNDVANLLSELAHRADYKRVYESPDSTIFFRLSHQEN